MKYKVGDRVFIKQGLEDGKKYGEWAFCGYNRLLNTDRLVKIEAIKNECSSGNYSVSHPLIKENIDFITDEMIAGYGFEYGEPMLVSDLSERQARNGGTVRHFAGFSESNGVLMYCIQERGYWRYAVPVPPGPKKITIEVTEEQLKQIKEQLGI